MDQDILNDITAILKSTTSIRLFLRPSAFKLWSKHFTTVTILGSQREGLCTAALHRYWQAVMTSFGQELLGGRGFSLIPFEGLHAIIFANPRLLLPTKSVVAYARKQSRSTIFEWQEKEKGWYLYASEYPPGWVKKVKVVNLSVLTKKGLMTWNVKPKFAKRGDDSFETCSDIILYGGGLPPIGNIVLENSPPPLLLLVLVPADVLLQASLCPPLQGHPWMLLLPIGLVAIKERRLHQPSLPPPRGEYVISKFHHFFILIIYRAFLWLIPYVYLFLSSFCFSSSLVV